MKYHRPPVLCKINQTSSSSSSQNKKYLRYGTARTRTRSSHHRALKCRTRNGLNR